MTDLQQKTEELTVKLQRLLDKQNRMADEMRAKDERAGELEKEMKTQRNTVKNLQQEIAALKLGNSVSLSADERKQVKNKINDYLRELDKVINKLSAAE